MASKPILHSDFRELERLTEERYAQMPEDPLTWPMPLLRGSYSMLQPPAPEIKVGSVEEFSFPGPDCTLRIRSYTPEGAGPFPIIIHYHGGGFVMGTLDTHDAPARLICQDTNCIVASVDYRIAPENPFPAFRDDCYAALEWIHENAERLGGDGRRIAVAGDSAGGCVAANMCLLARDRNGPDITAQLLMVPGIDADMTDPSFELRGNAMLNKKTCTMVLNFMVEDKSQIDFEKNEKLDLFFSPTRVENLAGLPPAVFLLGECDPLFFAGDRYAKRLKEAGVSVEVIVGEGMPHQFTSLAHRFPSARKYLEKGCEVLKRILYDA